MKGFKRRRGNACKKKTRVGKKMEILHLRELLRKTLKSIFGIHEVSCYKVDLETLLDLQQREREINCIVLSIAGFLT